MSDLRDTAVLVTAWRRPYYLERTLESWARVDRIREVGKFVVALGRSDREAEQLAVIDRARERMGRQIIVRYDSPAATASPGMHRALGEAASAVFSDNPGVQFLVFGEEDIVASADALRYLDWASRRFADDHKVLLACAHNCGGQGWDELGISDEDADPRQVRLRPYFQPWIWGTWRDRWKWVLEPQWDWECNSGGPNDSGYDWNICARIVPRGNYLAVVPDASRSQNIGEQEGVYAIPANFPGTLSASFKEDHGPVEYLLVTD